MAKYIKSTKNLNFLYRAIKKEIFSYQT